LKARVNLQLSSDKNY